jgi:hypothetical protein
MKRLTASYGGRLVVAVNPDPIEWSDEYLARLVATEPALEQRVDRLKVQRGYGRIARQEDIDFVDMLDGFPSVDVRQFRFALDPHANESGHRIIADQLVKGLEWLGIARRADAARR